MSGIRLAGRIPPVNRIIPYVLQNEIDLWISVWMNRHNIGPAELTLTQRSTAVNSPQLCDPMFSPDNNMVVYAIIPGTGTTNAVVVVPNDDSAAPFTIATWPNANNAAPNVGLEISMQPSWHPDGSVIIYRTTHSNSVVNTPPRLDELHSVEPDGTNDTVLLTSHMDNVGRFWWPTYNFDGSRIAFVLPDELLNGAITLGVCDADGTNFAQIATLFNYVGLPEFGLARVPFAWAHTQDKLVYYNWDSNTVRTINGDGTGDTSIYTDPDPFWGTMKSTWLLDDSGIVYSQYDSGSSHPKHEIGLLDPGGGGFTPLSPQRLWFGQSASGYPRLFPQDGRIWVQDGDLFGVVAQDITVSSVLPDGTDYTLEDDVDEAIYTWFTGFSYHD